MSDRAWRIVGVVMMIVAALLTVNLVLGCSAATPDVPVDSTGANYVTEQTILLNDGRQVVCLFFDPPTAANGALSCDWANAK